MCILIGQRYFWHPMREDIGEKHACSLLTENPASLVGYGVENRVGLETELVTTEFIFLKV